jgi:hypothetical protein
MPIVALAFHEGVALEKLNSYFAAGNRKSQSRTLSCTKCSLTFAVVLVNQEDRNNEEYLEDLLVAIEDDCINGLHREEYVLSVEAVH